MATNFRQLINRVMRKVGESEINGSATQLSTDYERLIGDIINDVKEEVEDAHNWRALRQTISVSISADAVSGTITGANERSRVLRIYQTHRIGYLPLVFDVTDASDPDPLIEMDLAELLYRDKADPDTRVSEPTYFAVDNSSGDVLDLYVWPRPSGARTISVSLIVPQARLADTDLDTNIAVPVRPIFQGAVWHAYEERGEELGPDSLFSEGRYQQALRDAIARDSAEQGDVFELAVS